jgi:MFS family permease
MKNQSLRRGIFICSLGALFYCYEYILRIVPGVIEPQLRQALGNLSASGFGTLSAFYYFAYTPMQLPVGIMMDWLGARFLLTVACGACALGAWLFTLTPIYAVSAFGRFLIGFGSAFAFVGVLKIADVWLPRSYLPVVAGLVTTLGMMGAVVGELGITMMVKDFGWQHTLNLTVMFGVFLTVMMLAFVKDDRQQVKEVKKRPGFGFVRDTLTVCSNVQIWLIGLIGALLFMSLSVFAEVWGKSYLVLAHQMTEMEAATAVSFIFVGWGIGAPIAGWLCEVINNKLLIILVGALLAGLVISTVLYFPDLHHLTVIGLLFLYGCFSSVEILVFLLGKDVCEHHLSGTAFAMVNMVVMFGGVLFQPLVGKLLDLTWSGQMLNGMRTYSVEHYQIALSFLPLSLLLSAILTFFLKNQQQSSL